MRHAVPDFDRLAEEMPCEEELLTELGRAAWAASLLHADLHRSLVQLDGEVPHSARQLSLAGLVAAVQVAAERHAAEPHRSAVVEWCSTIGQAAARSRDGVVHEIVNGEPLDFGLNIAGPPQRSSYGRRELVEITGRLVNAARTLPSLPVTG